MRGGEEGEEETGRHIKYANEPCYINNNNNNNNKNNKIVNLDRFRFDPVSRRIGMEKMEKKICK